VIAIAVRAVDFDIVKHIRVCHACIHARQWHQSLIIMMYRHGKQIRAYMDIISFTVSLVSTFWLGPVQGGYICLGMSAYQYIKRVSLPNVVVLGKRTIGGEWVELDSNREASLTLEGIVVLRVKHRLFFGNLDQLIAILSRVGMKPH
jgi:MFS superfamily sulfate permease-like transporter